MRSELAESLLRLGHRASALLPPDPSPELLASQTRQHRVPPAVFARYYALISLLQRGDAPSAARLWVELGKLTSAPLEFRIRPFSVEALGPDASYYQHSFAQGQESPADFTTPEAFAVDRLTRLITEARTLLTSVHPAWAAELQALIGEIIAVRAAAESFKGGSSMMLWGTVIMNAGAVDSRIAALSVLAHEATHLLLFGMARREPLTRNPVEQKFSTPLRPTPRPMNAVFHASYVSGRLCALFRLLGASRALDTAEQTEVAALAELQQRRFEQGLEVILAHGGLSPVARTLIDEAQALIR